VAEKEVDNALGACTVDPCGDSNDSLVISKKPDSLIVTIDRDFAVPAMLSLGIAAALIVFVVEAFNRPAEAERLWPLLVGGAPLCTAVINLMRCKKCGDKDAEH
jgi:hypothetical protein